MKKITFLFIIVLVVSAITAVFAIRTKNGDSPANVAVKQTSDYEWYSQHVDSLFSLCQLEAAGMDRKVFERALTGFYNLKSEGQLSDQKQLLTVVDFTKKSTEKRMWVVDLANHTVKYNTLVAHGKNTGEQYATMFSNRPQSNQSSLGFYVTGNTYTGKHGLSLLIDGKDKGFNDNARNRAVVVHGADYVSEQFIKSVGRIGRSQGCPALPSDIAPEVIREIANGTCLFIYFPDQNYEKTTHYFDLKGAIAASRPDTAQMAEVK